MDSEGCGYEPAAAGLGSWRFVRRVLSWRTTDSTNTRALDLARRGEADGGTLLLAGAQTAGRGRVGHAWHSAEQNGVYASLILTPAQFAPSIGEENAERPGRPPVWAFQPGWLTLAAGVAVHQALSGLLPPPAAAGLDLKWPNDVLWRGRKVCGILAESEVVGGEIAFVVLGVGVNVGQADFPGELHDRAVSLRQILGRPLSRREVLSRVLDALDEALAGLAGGGEAGIGSAWERASSYARGRSVENLTAGPPLRGKTEGLAADGALLIRTADGSLRPVYGGEVVAWQPASLEGGDAPRDAAFFTPAENPRSDPKT